MTAGDVPPAVPAATIAELIALGARFAEIVRAETAALRQGERTNFEALTAHKANYLEVLKRSLVTLEPERAKAGAVEKERWLAIAIDCETALQENARLIAGEQLHAAAMMDMLRQMMMRQQATAVGYGRDGRLKPRA